MLSPAAVFVTGSNRGIGLELIKQFVKLQKPPKYVFAACRDPDNAKDLQTLANSSSNVIIMKLDMNELDSFKSISDKVDETLQGEGLNMLINNAGVISMDTIDKVTAESMMQVYKINTVAPLMLTKAFIPALKRAASKLQSSEFSCNRAAIINMTSKVGSVADNTSGRLYPYRCSKAALNILTKSLSVELKDYGILANVLHPGWVKTDMGGPNALIDTATCVQGLMQVMSGLNEQSNGLMFDYAGKLIPW